MEDPSQSDTLVQVAQQTQPGQALSFTISGTGTISESSQRVAAGAAQSQGRDTRPGGGLGAPIDAPDPLQSFRWPILVGVALILALGAWVVMKRKPAISVVTAGGSAPAMARETQAPAKAARAVAAPAAVVPSPADSPASPSGSKSKMLLEGLKEEMFELELERRQGKISAAEYEKAKSALDQTLDRALKRQG